MKSISSWAITEKNKIEQSNVWIHLLEITWPHEGTPFRATSNVENVTWNGQTWTAYPMTIGEITEDLNSVPVCDISIANVDRVMEYYLLDYAAYTKTDGIYAVNVKVKVINSGNLLNLTPEVEHEFELDYGETNIEWATLRCSIPNPFKKRQPAYRILQNHCQYDLFRGIECGYAGVPGDECDRTLTTCRTYGNSGRWGGFAGVKDSIFRGGVA